MDVEHGDSALAMYYQAAKKSLDASAKMLLLTRLIEPAFFFNLRTTNRVGYVVHASPINILEVPGLLFSVQSPTHSPPQIYELIAAFLNQFEDTLINMSPAEFAQVKQGLLDRINARDKKLTDRANRYWREIDRREFTFDTRQRLAKIIGDLSQDEMSEFYKRLTETDARQLIVQSPGRRDDAKPISENEHKPVADAAQFRTTLTEFFPAYR